MSRREVVEAAMNSTTAQLQARAKILQSTKKLEGRGCRKDPAYRALEATLRKYKKRIAALDAVVALNADLDRRRAEKAAMPKEPKAKKKKEVAPVKAKGGGAKKEKKAAEG